MSTTEGKMVQLRDQSPLRCKSTSEPPSIAPHRRDKTFESNSIASNRVPDDLDRFKIQPTGHPPGSISTNLYIWEFPQPTVHDVCRSFSDQNSTVPLNQKCSKSTMTHL